MRYLFFIIFYFFNFQLTFAQNIVAHYKVSKDINVNEGDGTIHKLATLHYLGYYYEEGQNTIYFASPLFLKDYPDGQLTYQLNPNKSLLTQVSTDSIQSIFYRNFDTLLIRYRVDIGKSNSLNLKSSFKRGEITWTFSQETKQINGLNCQKAQFMNRNLQLQWVVWFCPDVPASAGPDGITDLPGLVVEAENKIEGAVFLLADYNTNISVPKSTFWPVAFLKPFK